jgi:hypothetical protein
VIRADLAPGCWGSFPEECESELRGPIPSLREVAVGWLTKVLRVAFYR